MLQSATVPTSPPVELPDMAQFFGPRYVTIHKFEALTGYTEDAVSSKIKRGQWLMDQVWVKAPDGRILIDLVGYGQWAKGEVACPPQPRPR